MAGVRSSLENKGYNVEYDPASGAIRVYDPKTGSSANILKGAYTLDKSGSAQVSDDVLNQVVNTISSGKYKYTGSKAQTTKSLPETNLFPNSPYTPVYKQDVQSTQDYLSDLKNLGSTAYETGQGMLGQYTKQQSDLANQAYAQRGANLSDYINSIQVSNTAYQKQQQDTINNYISQMNNFAKQYGDTGLAILQQYQKNFENSVNQVKSLMQQDPEVPQSVKLALNMLDSQLSNNIQYLNNEMNRRGVYNSSMAVNALQEAQSDIDMQKQGILANWLDTQQQQLYNTTLQLAKMYEDYANNYANLQSQYATKPLEIGMSALQSATGMQTNLNQQQWAALNDLYTNTMNYQNQIYNDYINAQNDIAKTGFSVGLQLYDTFVNTQKEAMQQGYQLPIALRNEYIRNSADYENAQQQLALEQQKMAFEVQKYLNDLAYKQQQLELDYARLGETQRHNRAMESRSSSSGSSLPKLLTKAEKTWYTTMLMNEGLDPTTASYLLDTYYDTAGAQLNKDAAQRQYYADINNPELQKLGIDFDSVYSALKNQYPDFYGVPDILAGMQNQFSKITGNLPKPETIKKSNVDIFKNYNSTFPNIVPR